tara:strand:+ start:2624 stop:3820 length:1197 start_codon:yes stop_codon:yes gene_type:complete
MIAKQQAFFVAASIQILVFACAGAPISLFNVYRAQDGLSHSDLGWVSLSYFIAAALALLVFGRLSNHLGRKPMAGAALLCVLLSCVTMIAMQNSLALLFARALQGFACGVAASSVGAYVTDLGSYRRKSWVALITSCAPMIGIPLGAVSSALLVNYAPAPKLLIYTLIATVAVMLLGLLLQCEETVQRKGNVCSALKPDFYMPKAALRPFATLSAVVVATWSIGGFYQAFGPEIVATALGSDNALISALAFSSVMVLTPLGGALAGRFVAQRAIGVAMLILVTALMVIACALYFGWLEVFLAASLSVGIAQGVASSAGMSVLIADISREHRAGMLASVYMVSYLGAVLPALIASIAANYVGVFTLFCGYAVLAGIAALIALLSSTLHSVNRAEPSKPT